MKRKVIVFTEDNELYKSLKRALGTIGGIKVIKSGKFNGKHHAVMRLLENSDEIDSWIWGEFRTKKRSLNPLIVIGFEDEKEFMSINPVFKAYIDEHSYLQIPFELNDMIKAISRLTPIYDQATRRIMVSDYSKGFEWKLITHYLKIIKGDKQATIENFLKAKDFYASKGDKEIARAIGDKIKEIRSKENREEIALEMKRYLEDRLKQGSK